ncbi:hypothetical protein H8959_001093 [Pygathrix nigripes]
MCTDAPTAASACTQRHRRPTACPHGAACRAGIKWEAEPRHDQKLFPYEEHLEMAILSLTL